MDTTKDRNCGEMLMVLHYCRTDPYIFLVMSLEHHKGGSEIQDKLTNIEPECGNEIVCRWVVIVILIVNNDDR